MPTKETGPMRRALKTAHDCAGGWQPENTADWRLAQELVADGLLARPTDTTRYTTTAAGNAALEATHA